MTDSLNAETSWTCPDCCLNPCKCTLMGDAAIRKDAGGLPFNPLTSPETLNRRTVTIAVPTGYASAEEFTKDCGFEIVSQGEIPVIAADGAKRAFDNAYCAGLTTHQALDEALKNYEAYKNRASNG